MNKFINILLAIVMLLLPATPVWATSGHRPDDGPAVSMPNTHVVPITDSQTQRQYQLLIKLPADYDKHKGVNYPVIYYTDAVWHIEMVSGNAYFIVEDVISVGISWQKNNNPALVQEVGEFVSRFRDYSILPARTEKSQAKYQMGQAAAHLAFIRNHVFSYVESHYRTDPNNRTYFGYSLGGSFGAWVLLSQPDSFKNYMLGSPSVWPRILDELKSVNKKREKKQAEALKNRRVYVSYGSMEDELRMQVKQFLALLQPAKKKGLSVKQSVIRGTHQTAAPGTVVDGLHWLSEFVPKLAEDKEDDEDEEDE